MRRRDPAAPHQGLRRFPTRCWWRGRTSARMISPPDVRVDIPIDDGFVGMVDRDALRRMAARAGRGARRRAPRRHVRAARARRRRHRASSITRARQAPPRRRRRGERARPLVDRRRRRALGGRQRSPRAEGRSHALRLRVPRDRARAGGQAGRLRRIPLRRLSTAAPLSPDFYGWVFPHGDTLSIGTGSADKGFSLRAAVARLREARDLGEAPRPCAAKARRSR